MTNSTVSWGLYPWFEEHGTALIHPDDVARFRALVPSGKVFEAQSGGEEEMMTLRYRDERYRVNPELFNPIAPPAFSFGQRVRITKTGDDAVVDEIQWHYQRGEPMFFLATNKGRLRKRFWASDILPAEVLRRE